MNKQQLEDKLKEEGILVFRGDDGYKVYVDGNKLFYDGLFHNKCNVFGIYKENDTRYAAFVTDAERGYPYFCSFKKSEEEACDYLYQYINTYI